MSETKELWTADKGWHVVAKGGPEDVHACLDCAAVGRFQWTPNAAPTCRKGHKQ